MGGEIREDTMKLKQVLIIIFILALLGGWPKANAEELEIITLDKFLSLLQKNHPLFAKEKLTPAIQREDQRSLRGAEDWKISSSIDGIHTESTLAQPALPDKDDVSITAGLDRLLWKTGGTFSAALKSGYVDNAASLQLPSYYSQNQLQVSYVQPLLKNRGGFLSRFAYASKAYDIASAEVQSQENQESFLLSNAFKFLDWVSYQAQIGILEERLRLSEEELETTRRKRSSNLVDEVDVIRAEDTVRSVKQSLELTRLQYKGLQGELAVVSKNQGLYAALPDFAIYKIAHLASPEHERNITKLENESRLIKPLKILLEQLSLTKRKYEEDNQADLSLILAGTLKDVDENFDDSYGLNKTDATVSLKYTIPWERTTTKSQIKKTDLQIGQVTKQMEEVGLTLTASLTSLYIQIKEMENVLTLNQEQIVSAKKRTREEIKLYNQGRTQSTFVIQSQDNEQNAKLTYVQNAVLYQKLILQYQATLDELLVAE